MESLLDSVAGFHDAMAKEFHIGNRGHVMSDHSMAMSHCFDLQLLIQSQCAPFCVELVFCNVRDLRISNPGEFYDATGSVTRVSAPVGKVDIELEFDACLSIKAEELYYCVRDSWLGPQTFFGHEIPSSAAIPASKIDEVWRQCSNCSDAWEESPDVVFSRCPSCGELTEI